MVRRNSTEKFAKYSRFFCFSGDDRKRANVAFCLSKLNIKSLSSLKILQENFPRVEEKTDENLDDFDHDEHLAWKKYLMVCRFFLYRKSIDNSLFFFSPY